MNKPSSTAYQKLGLKRAELCGDNAPMWRFCGFSPIAPLSQWTPRLIGATSSSISAFWRQEKPNFHRLCLTTPTTTTALSIGSKNTHPSLWTDFKDALYVCQETQCSFKEFVYKTNLWQMIVCEYKCRLGLIMVKWPLVSDAIWQDWIGANIWVGTGHQYFLWQTTVLGKVAPRVAGAQSSRGRLDS